MTKQEFNKAIAKGLDYIEKSELVVKRATRRLAKDKGFKNYRLFDCSYTGDLDILVNIGGYGELSELSLHEMFDLTKEEITDRLLNHSYLRDEERDEVEKLLK